MKKLKWIILALVLVIIVGFSIVVMNLDGIVRRTVESQATSSLDVKTTLAAAHLSIFGGSLGLDDLKIASPPDYKAPQMLSLDKAGVEVSLGQLRDQPIHIKKVTLDAPNIVLEANGTKLNFQALMDRQSKEPSDPKRAGEPMKVIIDELTVTNPKISLRPGLSVPGLQEEYSLTLPSLTLSNIGTGEGNQNGVAIKQVVVQLLTTIAAKAAESDQLPPELKNLLHLNVQQVAGQLGKQAADQINKQIEKIGGPVGDVLKDKDVGKQVEKGIGDLLGGKERKNKDKQK